MINSLSSRQRGNFTVEFALVGIIFSFLIAFSGDIIIKLAIRGKLDRMAYSAASIIKERTQLFKSFYDIDEANTQEGQNTYTYITNSLTRTLSSFDENKFGYSLDVFTSDGTNITRVTPYIKGIKCSVGTPPSSMFVTTDWGRNLTLYQVSLCYETNNWFGSLIGKTYSRVGSYAVVMGR